MQKKLLYLASRVFWPTKDGHEVHILNYCRALHEKYGYTVDVYIFEKQEIVEKALADKPGFLRNVIAADRISKADILKNVLTKTVFGKESWSLQSCLYVSQANGKRLERQNLREHYDVLFVDMVRLAPYIRSFAGVPCRKVLDMGDLLSKRYKRQIASVNRNSNIGGAFTNRMPKAMRSVLKAKWLQAAILTVENKLMEKAEVFWAEKYDSVILVSEVETEELNRKLAQPKAVTVHVGVDCEYFGAGPWPAKVPGLAVFVGDMYTAANVDTVNYIASNILPLCKKVKQVELIGRCAAGLQETYRQNGKIHFAGMVPDLRSEVKKANVFLAPMAYGTGVKIKIVEAMAMGMPVVTNRIGAEGIPGEHGVHWLVGSSEQEIAGYVDELLDDPRRCAEMGRNAQQLVEETFSWDAATRAFARAGL